MNDLITLFSKSNFGMPLICGSTGIAALNVGGVTAHSFFGLGINNPSIYDHDCSLKPEKVRVLAKVPFIIVDEVSMLHSNLLDVIDNTCREAMAMHHNDSELMMKPFAGIPILFVGDMFQLPPVANDDRHDKFDNEYESEFFFSSKVFANFSHLVYNAELKINYRQKEDIEFANILDKVRDGGAVQTDADIINKRVGGKVNKGAIVLTTTNKKANTINLIKLRQLSTDQFMSKPILEGKFPKSMEPIIGNLTIKPGAQIMMLNNDQQGRWVNGSIGVVEGVGKNDDGATVINVSIGGESYEVTKHTWDRTEPVSKTIRDSDGKVKNVVVNDVLGSYTQYPMKLAWAITIHKSQGQTFDNCIIDLERGAFAAGQLYVALSRCTSMGGISMVRPMKMTDMKVDDRVISYYLSTCN